MRQVRLALPRRSKTHASRILSEAGKFLPAVLCSLSILAWTRDTSAHQSGSTHGLDDVLLEVRWHQLDRCLSDSKVEGLMYAS